jgi:cyclopropane-fatty-acyl-phospholipid synthase
MTLGEAQLAKVDLALGKLGLEPGMTLLDVGCGWGSTMMRRHREIRRQRHRVDLVEEPGRPRREGLRAVRQPRTKRVMLKGWEEFDEPVDRIVSIGAFEHFGFDRYDDFFNMAHEALPDDGVMLLHTITALTGPQMVERGMPLTFNFARFVKFMITEIFPGGRLPSIEKVDRPQQQRPGFTLARRQSLQPHYCTYSRHLGSNLEGQEGRGDRDQSEEVYERYMRYLTGCADGSASDYIDVNSVHAGRSTMTDTATAARPRSTRASTEVRAHYDLSNEFFSCSPTRR